MYSICNIKEDCPMRHENGNCLPMGGCCPALKNEICDALQQAFEMGYRTGYMECRADELRDTSAAGGFHDLED